MLAHLSDSFDRSFGELFLAYLAAVDSCESTFHGLALKQQSQTHLAVSILIKQEYKAVNIPLLAPTQRGATGAGGMYRIQCTGETLADRNIHADIQAVYGLTLSKSSHLLCLTFSHFFFHHFEVLFEGCTMI